MRLSLVVLRRWAAIALCAMAGYWGMRYWREHRFDPVINAAARRYQLDPALVKAIVWRESRFNPLARGRAGELGLMQIREVAALEWASSERLPSFDYTACLDPATNTMAGAWYLKRMLRHYSQVDDPLPYALAEYNAGGVNVRKWRAGAAATNSQQFLSQITFPSTRAYIESILMRRDEYK